MSANKIFIIGAGASREVTKKLKIPIPLATDFFKSEFINKYWPNNHLAKHCFANSETAKFIAHYFGIDIKKLSKKNLVEINSSLNIEEVYSFVEMFSKGYYNLKEEKFIIERVRVELLDYICWLIREISYEIKNPILYKKIESSLKKGDTIITFNWDLIFEILLSKTNKGKKYLRSQYELLPESCTKQTAPV